MVKLTIIRVLTILGHCVPHIYTSTFHSCTYVVHRPQKVLFVFKTLVAYALECFRFVMILSYLL